MYAGINNEEAEPSKLAVHVLLLEPNTHGHRGFYVRWVAEALAAAGCRVTVVVHAGGGNHPSMQGLADGQRIRIVERDDDGPGGEEAGALQSLIRELQMWMLFRSWFRTLCARDPVDLVMVPYADYCLYACGLLGSPFGATPWAGITMRPSFHFSAMGVLAPPAKLAAVKAALFRRVIAQRSLRRLFSLDETLVAHAGGAGSSKLSFLPEPVAFSPVHARDEARAALGLQTGAPMLLVFGALTARKGVVTLIEAMLRPGFPPQALVVLAGRMEPELLPLLAQAAAQQLISSGRLLVRNWFHTGEEEALLYAASDAVWLGYHGHYTSSGVLAHACAAGRPVLGCREGLIGYRLRTGDLGIAVDAYDPDAVAEGARRVLAAPPHPAAERAHASQALFSTVAEFGRNLCAGLGLAMPSVAGGAENDSGR